MEIQPRKPVSVSPLIRAARWSFFLSGILYGKNKLAFYRVFDKKRAEIRHKIIHENEVNEAKLNAQKNEDFFNYMESLIK